MAAKKSSKKQKPTAATVREIARKLEEIKPRVRARSAFGDDNHAMVDAQLRVMKENMSHEQIAREFDRAGVEQDVLDSAYDARGWMDGDGNENPYETWAPLVSQ